MDVLVEMSLSTKMNDLQTMKQDIVCLLIGKTGSGKSTTGNIIFNETVFQSQYGSSSVTRVCQAHRGAVNNCSVTVIDTPDFIYSTHTDFDSDSELRRSLELCAPGAHVILLILSLSTFTEQEKEFIDWFERNFGSDAFRFTIVLFTHVNKTHVTSLGEMIRINTQLSGFIHQCGQRYHEFNIKHQTNRRQVTELMEKINRMMSENRNSCYSLEMMEENKSRRKEKEMRTEEEKRREEETGEREHEIRLESVRRETETRVRKEYEQEILEKQRKEMREEEERQEREHQINMDNRETKICVRREVEQEILEKQRKEMREVEQEKAEKRKTHLSPKQKYVCVIMCFAVVTGGVLMWKERSLNGWMFLSGGLAATAGVFTGILWRLMWKSQLICSSSHERPSSFRQLLLKTLGVMCGLPAGAAVGHFVAGNIHLVTVLAGLAGAAGAFTAIK